MSLSVSKWLIGIAALLVSLPLAADWPQWRGPNRDGVTQDFVVPTTWPATLKEAWKVTVGEGHSSPVTSEGRIYVLARQGEDEVVLCLEAQTGKQLWRTSYPAAYTMNPAATGHGKGPKSTPVVSGGKLFTFGINGVLSCFDAKSGKLNWRKEFSKQYPNTSPLYGTAMSPIVANGLCIVHVGGHDKGALTAFDIETGAVKWANAEDGPAYSSPVLTTLAGEPQLVTYTQSNVVGISATTGKLLWKMANKVPYDVNSVSPVVYKDLVIFSIYEKGIGAIRLSKSGDRLVPQEVWRNTAYESYMNTPVLAGNRLAGFSYKKKGQFFCLDADTGKLLWESAGRMGENVAILNAGNLFFFLNDEAKLFVLKSDATSFAPVKEYQVASSPTWAHPVLLGNRILVKDKTSFAALTFQQWRPGVRRTRVVSVGSDTEVVGESPKGAIQSSRIDCQPAVGMTKRLDAGFRHDRTNHPGSGIGLPSRARARPSSPKEGSKNVQSVPPNCRRLGSNHALTDSSPDDTFTFWLGL